MGVAVCGRPNDSPGELSNYRVPDVPWLQVARFSVDVREGEGESAGAGFASWRVNAE
jgi:hypothetical protein